MAPKLTLATTLTLLFVAATSSYSANAAPMSSPSPVHEVRGYDGDWLYSRRSQVDAKPAQIDSEAERGVIFVERRQVTASVEDVDVVGRRSEEREKEEVVVVKTETEATTGTGTGKWKVGRGYDGDWLYSKRKIHEDEEVNE
ncbi:hypothetical protein DFH27DRAFT_614297 [Peziza echinospora]|nr:hypothetical protein DFH27DRAFT_614297 [Peziza echinospora]